jgi:hypothetical protein
MARQRLDEPPAGSGRIEDAPQQVNVLREIAVFDASLRPEQLVQALARYGCPAMFDENDEQIEGSGVKRDGPSVEREPPRRDIEDEPVKGDDRALF